MIHHFQLPFNSFPPWTKLQVKSRNVLGILETSDGLPLASRGILDCYFKGYVDLQYMFIGKQWKYSKGCGNATILL